MDEGGTIDIRLDPAFADYYRDNQSNLSHSNLPAPLDTTTLFSHLVGQVYQDHAQGRPLPTVSPNPHVQLMFANLVHGAPQSPVCRCLETVAWKHYLTHGAPAPARLRCVMARIIYLSAACLSHPMLESDVRPVRASSGASPKRRHQL